MSFMKPQYEHALWYEVETTHGTEFVPANLVGDKKGREYLEPYLEGEYISHEMRTGVGARLSAPGYMDCTSWTVFDTKEEARAYIEETYEVDPDTGEELVA